jgi:hypothetical protein
MKKIEPQIVQNINIQVDGIPDKNIIINRNNIDNNIDNNISNKDNNINNNNIDDNNINNINIGNNNNNNQNINNIDDDIKDNNINNNKFNKPHKNNVKIYNIKINDHHKNSNNIRPKSSINKKSINKNNINNKNSINKINSININNNINNINYNIINNNNINNNINNINSDINPQLNDIFFINHSSRENLNNSFLLLNDLSSSINKSLSQSVFDLVNCFICLSPSNEPLTCPKCNNFACKRCLEKYFENHRVKRCPMCKGDIKLSELKENKIIEEIENILKNNQNQNNKINELSALIQEKKKLWEDQTNNINNLIEKIFKFQEDLEKYKKEFHEFMIKCQSLVDSTFQDVNLKMESLINSLLSYNNVIDDSIKKYNDIYDNNQKNRYGNNNIKQFINEIIALERKHFNDKTFSEVENFLYSPIKLVPSINLYNIKSIKIKKENLLKDSTTISKGNHYKLGAFELLYNFDIKDEYKISCKITFNLREDNCKKMCFLLSQLLEYKNKKGQLIPMNLIISEENKYIYECTFSVEEFFNLNENEITFKTEALIFTMQ